MTDVLQMTLPQPTSTTYDLLREQILALARHIFHTTGQHIRAGPDDTLRIALRFISNVYGRGVQCVLTHGRWGEGRRVVAEGDGIHVVTPGYVAVAMRSLLQALQACEREAEAVRERRAAGQR